MAFQSINNSFWGGGFRGKEGKGRGLRLMLHGWLD